MMNVLKYHWCEIHGQQTVLKHMVSKDFILVCARDRLCILQSRNEEIYSYGILIFHIIAS